MVVLRRGGPYFSGGPPYQEGTEFNYIGGNWTLTLSYPHLTEQEIEAVGRGVCFFGAYVQDDVLFFLYKFGVELGQRTLWEFAGDAPYNFALVPEEYRVIPEPYVSPERCVLQVVLVESSENRIETMRQISASPAVTEVMVNAIRHQVEIKLSTDGYEERLEHIRGQHSVDQMFDLGVYCCGGD